MDIAQPSEQRAASRSRSIDTAENLMKNYIARARQDKKDTLSEKDASEKGRAEEFSFVRRIRRARESGDSSKLPVGLVRLPASRGN